MTDTLRIAELPAGSLGGLIGVTLAPGKKQAGGMSGDHDRDLSADLDVIAAWNAAAVVTLMEDDELRRFRIDDIGEAVFARFMEWHHLPIRDGEVPGRSFEAEWPRASARLRAMVGAGNRRLAWPFGVARADRAHSRPAVRRWCGEPHAMRRRDQTIDWVQTGA